MCSRGAKRQTFKCVCVLLYVYLEVDMVTHSARLCLYQIWPSFHRGYAQNAHFAKCFCSTVLLPANLWARYTMIANVGRSVRPSVRHPSNSHISKTKQDRPVLLRNIIRKLASLILMCRIGIDPSHLRFLLPTRLPYDNRTGQDLSPHHFVFSFTFHFFVYCVW